jgi:hypothetical protein
MKLIFHSFIRIVNNRDKNAVVYLKISFFKLKHWAINSGPYNKSFIDLTTLVFPCGYYDYDAYYFMKGTSRFIFDNQMKDQI